MGFDGEATFVGKKSGDQAQLTIVQATSRTQGIKHVYTKLTLCGSYSISLMAV